MRFQHVAEQIYHRPWLITPSAHHSVQQLLESKLCKSAYFEASDANASAFFVPREAASLDVNGIGHMSIKGVVGQGLSPIEKTCGNTDTRDVQAEIAGLVAQGAKGILLCIDSPGGTITGTPELAETIAVTAADIPVFVFSDSQICSAAYWLACGASKIVCTESAEIGSIGVYLPWIDRSAQWEEEGIKADPVINTGGNLKAIGFGPSLSPAHRDQLQSFVDNIFEKFRSAVVQSRALNEAAVPDTAMQGQVFLGEDAVSNGLVDLIANKDDAYELLLQEIDLDETPAVEAEPADEPQESLTTEDTTNTSS